MEIDTHALNKAMADFCGIHVDEFLDRGLGWENIAWMIDSPEKETWTPLTDHNQMALVEAALREKGCRYHLVWDRERKQHGASVYEEFVQGAYFHESKLIAFALAVQNCNVECNDDGG